MAFFAGTDYTGLWLPLASLLPAWLLTTAVYRIYFHPLARYPGRKAAALTTWYEAYFDIVKKGRYLWEIEDMHREYGPIVRIGPNELHIRDRDHYEKLYNRSKRLDKCSYFYGMIGTPLAGFGTIRADTHRMRRSALNPFFSAQAVSGIRPLMYKLIDSLCARIAATAAEDKPIPLFYAYRCLTVDIISEYAFGGQMGLIDREDWGREFYSAWRTLWVMSPLIRQIPFMMGIMMGLPRWLSALLNPKGLEIVDLFARVDAYMEDLLNMDAEQIKSKPHRTAMWEVAHADSLPPEERTLKRLSLEAVAVLSGGFETTAAALTLGTFLVLYHPEVHERLKRELAEAIPDAQEIPSWQQLEKLPYLSSVMRETLRISVGAFGRLPRVNPNEDMTYGDWVIPKKSAVGMSAYFIHMDPEIFPEPQKFDPERWMVPEERQKLDRYLFNFSRGPRSCLGVNLAYAELYAVMATMIRRFPDMELYDTTWRDMELVHDYFSGMARHERDGLQIKIKNVGKNA